jgi:hypothetical protein
MTQPLYGWSLTSEHTERFKKRTSRIRENWHMYDRIRFHLVKLPFILLLITFGFIFEFLITLPFIVLCTLDNLFRGKN